MVKGSVMIMNEVRMASMRYGRTITGVFLFALLIILPWTGCSRSGSGPAAGSAGPVVTEKASLSASSGGAISVTIPDGSTVTIEIPEGALETQTDLTLTVSSTGSVEKSQAKSADTGLYSSLSIKVEPAMDLLDSATLSVVFPDGSKGSDRCLTLKSGQIPSKQSFRDNILKASVYRLGEWECSKVELSDMIDDAQKLMEQTPGAAWQDAYALFDALLFYASVFSDGGRESDSAACFAAVADLCKESAVGFLASLGPDGEEKNDIRVNSLKKFRSLMVMCENPGEIVKSFDEKLLAADGS